MGYETELTNALEQLVKRDVPTFMAVVISVDKENGTCVVSDDDIELTVRLSSVINESKEKFFLFPKIGSNVLVSPIEEDIHQLYIDKYSEVEEFNFKVGNCELSIDNSGFNFKKNTESLKSLMLEFITTVRAMKFTTNTGPTILLLNDLDFVILENKFKALLKDI